MKKGTLLLIGVALAGGLWYLKPSGPPTGGPDQAAGVIDNSISQALQCDALPALALDALSDLHIGKRSRFTVFSLGSPESSWEPVMRYDAPAPRKGGSMFGGSFADGLKRACAGTPKVKSSSIYRAVEVALDHLHGEACGQPGIHCKLLVESDGEENVSRSFYRHVGKNGAGKTTLLNNTGIKVLWCNYAVTDSGGGPRGERTNALIARWRASFIKPDDVAFKPYCGSSTPAATQASMRR